MAVLPAIYDHVQHKTHQNKTLSGPIPFFLARSAPASSYHCSSTFVDAVPFTIEIRIRRNSKQNCQICYEVEGKTDLEACPGCPPSSHLPMLSDPRKKACQFFPPPTCTYTV